MLDMYKGMINSPETTITNDINAVDTIIYVLDETKVPEELPNLMTLGTGTSAETVKVLEVNGNALTVERGFQGVPRNWNAGTVIARNFTEYDYNALMENIKTLKTKADTNADDILDLMSYVGDLENLDTTEKANLVLALNETYQDLASHKAESVSDIISITRDISVTGVQTITVSSGRKPKRISTLAIVPGTDKVSISHSHEGDPSCVYRNDGTWASANTPIVLSDGSGNRTFGSITNIKEGSFDINWTHTLAGATGTAKVSFTILYHD